MIISTARSRIGFVFDVILTIIGWAGFVFLFGRGIVAILRGASQGPDAPVLSAFFPTLGTLSAYALIALINAAILICWAVYNHWRFAGLDRRKAIAAIPAAHMARSFALSPEEVGQLGASKIAMVHHDADGRIKAISKQDYRSAAA